MINDNRTVTDSIVKCVRDCFVTSLLVMTLVSSSNSDTIKVDSLTRNYIVHLPTGYSKVNTYPLVLAIHGGGGTAEGMIKLTHFSDVADKYNFVVVYPDAVEKNWNDGRPDSRVEHLYDDVKFISMLIDTLINLYNVDSKRVYSTGISNGGLMSFCLACTLPDKITAIAPVAASMPESPMYECNINRPVPVMIIFGNDDPLVPFEGGEISAFFGTIKRGKVRSVRSAVDFWVAKNNASGKKIYEEVNEVRDGTSLFKETWSEGTNSEVQYWLFDGAGHTWPGGQGYLPKILIGRTSKEFDASVEIWKFFSGKIKE